MAEIALGNEVRKRSRFSNSAFWVLIAGWFGVVNERKKDFWVDHPKLVEYINRTCEFKIKTDDYVIYRIRNPEEVAKLPNQ